MTDEERVLCVRAGVDVSEHMGELYEQHRRLIAKLAGRFKAYAEFDDLMQEGYIGLSQAVERFEEEKGAAFSTYAVYWIRQAMRRLAAAGRKNGQLSLDGCTGEGEHSRLSEFLAAERDDCAETLERIWQEERKAVIWPLVDSLEERQARTLRLRYQEGKTRKEAGSVLGCSQSQVRRWEEKALRRLRRPRYAACLRPFLHEEEVLDRGMKGTGVRRFRETWTSATERTAIQDVERRRCWTERRSVS